MKVVEKLVDVGKADVNAENDEGWSVLNFAVVEGNASVVEKLVAAGAKLQAANREGNTALHVAALCGRLEVAEKLLALGADKTVLNSSNQSPGQCAAEAEEKNPALIELLGAS